MADGDIEISPDETREASTWPKTRKELRQQNPHEGNTEMEEMVEAAYATPGRNGTQGAIEGPQGVSEFIQQVAGAFADTDSQTSGAIG